MGKHIDTKADSQTSVSKLWDEISALFKPWSAVKSSRVWVTSMSARISRKRLTRLRSSKEAKTLTSKLKILGTSDIKALRTFAAINQEQAAAAFKVTIVGEDMDTLGLS